MKKDYIENSKAFLSKNFDENSSISWHTRTEGNCVEAEIILKDCFKRIDLTFWVDDTAAYGIDQRVEKVNVLVEELIRFREAMKRCHSIQSLLKHLHDVKKRKKKC